MLFEIHQCPLCKTNINSIKSSCGGGIYSCPTVINYLDCDGHRSVSHYKVIDQGSLIAQILFVGPYQIESCSCHDTSHIIKYFPTELEDGVAKWKNVGYFPKLHLDTEINMVNRINKLLVFL